MDKYGAPQLHNHSPAGAVSREARPEAMRERSALSDEELIRLVVARDVDLFETLIQRHANHVSRIVSGHVPSEQVPEVAHEVFVKAYTSLGTYAFEQPFPHWLATIAVRTCYDYWRARHKSEVPISALTTDHQNWIDRVRASQSDEEFFELHRQQEAAAVLHWALARLSPENRMVLTLVHLDGHSVREAATLLGWSVVNVKVRAHRARQALRTILLKER